MLLVLGWFLLENTNPYLEIMAKSLTAHTTKVFHAVLQSPYTIEILIHVASIGVLKLYWVNRITTPMFPSVEKVMSLGQIIRAHDNH